MKKKIVTEKKRLRLKLATALLRGRTILALSIKNISLQKFIRATSKAIKQSTESFYITEIIQKYKNIENI